MAQRHSIDPSRVETVLVRLEELVRANSGDDPFDEVFKIILVKLYSEKMGINLDLNEKKLKVRFDEMLVAIDKTWPNLLTINQKRTLLSEGHLRICLHEIETSSFFDEGLVLLDVFFEHLVSHTSKGQKGQFFTPRYIIEFCTKIIAPKFDENILDPACGSGGFLFHSLNYIKNHSDEHSKNIWGFDFDPRAVSVAKTLFSLCGGNADKIFNVNSLLRQSQNTSLLVQDAHEKNITIEDILRIKTKKFNGFDAILTNPPFAGEIKQESLINSYDLAKSNRRNERDVLFVERCIELLKPNGRLAIVLPHNKIGGKSYSYVREYLMRKMRVVCVVSLPRTTFLPHTHQKAEIIFAKKREKPVKNIDSEEILFITSDVESKDTKGNLILKNESDSNASDWDRINHDFEDCILHFNKFISETGLEWY
ncbi:HsdM family class I SAM-dependent methyltransferase [Vibrio metoecus]|uniref:HsdM family class I SAM-dependent methyltransferase n=1 Tax=Vibrio metoecus TaxID=1481663 RepID=UPI0006D7D038|nr:N-6 DNA methylase [Vibrio metoecus]